MLLDGGFENGTGWTYTGLAQRTTDAAQAGSYSGKLRTNKSFGSGNTSTITSETLTLELGSVYSLTIYANADSVSNSDVNLRVEANRGDGAWFVVTTLPPGSIASGWQSLPGLSFTANGTSGGIRFRSTQTAGAFAADSWFIDSIVVAAPAEETAEVITGQVKTALVADLTAIDGTGSFSTTVAEVGIEPKRIDEAQFPGVYIHASEGLSDLATVTNLRGECEQTYTLDLVIRSNTPNADMDSFLDDVRNACERSAGTVMDLGAVDKVTVTDWTPVETDPEIHQGTYWRQVNVVVTYLYTRGSA